MRVAMAAAPGQPEGVASLATPPSVPAPTPAEGGGGLVHAGHASVVNSQRWLLVTIDWHWIFPVFVNHKSAQARLTGIGSLLVTLVGRD